jgi:hypothetical protein
MAPYILAGTQQQGYVDGHISSAQFSYPQGLVFDSSGNLSVADAANHVIRKINLISQQVTTFAGTPSNSTFTYPAFISYDGIGKFYVSGLSYGSGIKIISDGQVTSMPPAQQFTPFTAIILAVPDDSLYYYDFNTREIYEIKYVNTNYELLCEKGANGPQGPAGPPGPPGPISPITIIQASSQSFTPADKGNTYIITSNSHTYHNINTGSLTTSDAGFYVYLRNGNPKTGYDIIIYYNTSPVNDTEENSVLFSHSANGNASNCILYWSGTGFTLY